VSIAPARQAGGGRGEKLIEELDAVYPANRMRFKSRLCQVLLALGGTDAVAKSMQLMTDAPTQVDQLFYLHHLRRSRTIGRLSAQAVISVVQSDGSQAGCPGVREEMVHRRRARVWSRLQLRKLREEHSESATDTISADEKTALASVCRGRQRKPLRRPPTGARDCENWKMAIWSWSSRRWGATGFRARQDMFTVGQCACVTNSATRAARWSGADGCLFALSAGDILESILEPSKVISDQYANQ